MHTKTSSTDRGTKASSSPPNAKGIGGLIRHFTQNAARLLALALVAYGPWFYGSASWNSQVVCVVTSAVVALLAVATNLRSLAKLAVPHWSLAGILVLALLQTVSLPEPLWGWLSPNADFQGRIDRISATLLDENTASLNENIASTASSGTATMEYPRTISVYPEHTLATTAVAASALAMMLAGTLLFTTEQWRVGALLTFTVVGIANAMVGLMQTIAWNDWTLLDAFNGRNSFATFVNRNSVAQYYSIALGSALGVLVAWNKRKGGRSAEKKYHVRYPAVNVLARLRRRLEEVLTELDPFSLILLVVICLLLVSVLAAASRGGILACGLALAVSVIALLGKKSNIAPLALGITAIACAAILFLSSFELDEKVSTRLGTISEEIHQLSNARFQLWSEVLSQSEYWLTGSGMGTFHLAVLQCPLIGSTSWFYHAENIYIETLVTTGILGCIALLLAVGWLLRSLILDNRHSQTALKIATLLPIVAIAVQSLTDFSLILPAIFLPLSLLVGMYCRERTEHSTKSKKRRRSSVQDLRERHGRPSDASRETSKRTANFRWTATFPVVTLLFLILSCMAFGLPTLLDFGKAEALARSQGGRKALPTIDLNYERARQEQMEFSRAFQSLNWPTEMDPDSVHALTRPEVTVAAVGFQSPPLAPVAELLAEDPRLAPLLERTCRSMLQTAEKCPMDWRANWGMLRSDLGVLSEQERARTASRILITANHKPTLLRTVGTHFYWTGQRRLGQKFWQASLNAHPRFDSGFYVAAAQLFKPEDLDVILPDNPITRVSVAKGLKSKDLEPLANGLLEKVDRELLTEQAATVRQWLIVEWLANQDQDVEREILALRNVTRLAPMEPKYSYRLAQRLRETGDLEEALKEINYAVRRSPNTQAYKDFESQLKEELRQGP